MGEVLRFENRASPIPAFSLLEDERVVLSAPSGWGKSRWLKQLALLADAQTASVTWHGQCLQPNYASRYRKAISYLPQKPEHGNETARQQLERVLALQAYDGLRLEPLFTQLQKAVESLGLAPRVLETPIRALSGGEAQFISLARAVLLRPEVLLLDEPTSAMDAVLCRKAELWFEASFDGACVWVTHDKVQIRRLQDMGFCARIA